MYESKDRAREIIVAPSEFFRLSFDNTGEQEVSLAQEIDFIERYPEIEALYDLVPNLVLQPYRAEVDCRLVQKYGTNLYWSALLTVDRFFRLIG